MKLYMEPEHLKYLTLGAGGLGLGLRTILYATGIDEKGLLISGHWAGVLLILLTAVVIVGIFLLTRTVQGPEQYGDAFPASVTAGLGAFAAAAAMLITTFTEFSEFTGIGRLIGWMLGLLGGVALAIVGFCRIQGRKPHFLLHAVVCAYFALRMVNQYQLWNSDPQILDYAFYLSACISLMLVAYQHSAFGLDMGSHKTLWCLSLLAVFLCLVSLKSGMDTWLMPGCGIWIFTNLTNLRVRRRRPRPVLNLDTKPEE